MKTKSLLASLALALVAVTGAHAQVYVRAAVVARPVYYPAPYRYYYPAPVVVATNVAAGAVAAPGPAVVVAPAPAVVISPVAYWGGWYGWGPRYYARSYPRFVRGWRR